MPAILHNGWAPATPYIKQLSWQHNRWSTIKSIAYNKKSYLIEQYESRQQTASPASIGEAKIE